MKQGSENHKGFILLGDSLNMRHPLTGGGGMTVGLNDSVLLAKLLHPKFVEDFDDHQLIAKKIKHSTEKKEFGRCYQHIIYFIIFIICR